MTDLTRLFTDLVRAETRLYNAVEARLRAEHGIAAGQFEMLQIIKRHGTCRVHDIVHEVAITVGAASKAVDRLEAAGWCERTANPDDRRSSLISVTPAGDQVIEQAKPTFEDELAARLRDVVSPQDLSQAAKTLAALRIALEEHQRA